MDVDHSGDRLAALAALAAIQPRIPTAPMLTFSKGVTDSFAASQVKALPFLDKFGPGDLLALVQTYKFDFPLTQYNRVFLPGTVNIDVQKSPIISVVPPEGSRIVGPITTETQIAQLTAHSDNIAELKTHSFRDSAIEPGAKAAAQCKFIYDRLPRDKPVDCWLCGYPLDVDPVTGGKTLRSSVQCEHILPAAAALIFHGIIDEAADVDTHGSAGSDPSEREDQGDLNFFKLNYELAHAECNYPKKDTLLFLTLFYTDHTIVGTPQLNIPLIKKFIDSLLEPLANKKQTLVYDFVSREHEADAVNKWKARRYNAITARLKPLLVNLQAGIKLWLLVGLDKLLKNIDYMYAKYVIPGGVVFPNGRRKPDGGGEWYPQAVKTKKDYNDFIDLANAKSALPRLQMGARRKRTRKVKKNGKFSTSRRRLRSKVGNRKNSRANRKT